VHAYLLIVCRALSYRSEVCLGSLAARLVASAVFSETAFDNQFLLLLVLQWFTLIVFRSVCTCCRK